MIASPPKVRCTSCAYEWRSSTLAADLRFLGHCPRCRGELDFLEADTQAPAAVAAEPTVTDARAPHLVLGVPRLDF